MFIYRLSRNTESLVAFNCAVCSSTAAPCHWGGGVYEEHHLISAYWRGGVCEEHLLIGAQSSTFLSFFLSFFLFHSFLISLIFHLFFFLFISLFDHLIFLLVYLLIDLFIYLFIPPAIHKYSLFIQIVYFVMHLIFLFILLNCSFMQFFFPII